MYNLNEKNVLVVGLGRSGVAAAGYAASRGARVTVTDLRPEEKLTGALASLEGFEIKKALGANDVSLFDLADLVIISPGVPDDHAGVLKARAKGVPVVGEMELALAQISKPIVAITGTNGKTTTTTLVGHLMDACNIPNCVGGNIGKPLIGLVQKANESHWVVLEVSSFQLENTPSLSPKIAVWLNATPDHLDRHPSFEAYVELKARLFAPLTPASWGIYNVSDEVVRGAVLSSRGTLIPFDPASPLKTGGWYEEGDLWVDVANFGKQRFGLADVSLEGRHNRENMLAAIIAVLLAGGNRDAIQQGLESFKGLPHRLEFVAEIHGVRFFDDSKGTNVGATMRALDSFAEPIILIAGGQDKAGDFGQLEPLIRKGVKRLILIGEAKSQMRRALGGAAQTVDASSMEEAVSIAWRASEPGDVVLLSPACASFDMFRDYAHRGEVFQAAVKGLAEKNAEN